MKSSSLLRAASVYAHSSSANVFAARSSSTACQTVLYPTYSPPTVDSGWTASLIVSGLSKPRSIVFDGLGALLVLESGVGIKRITFTDYGRSCLVAETVVVVVNETSLNHGLALSSDGTTIYASNSSSVLAWPYNTSTGSVIESSTTVISGMTSHSQVTRTLLISNVEPDMLIVSRGSDESYEAISQSSGLGQIKAFNLSELSTFADPVDFDSTGRLLGWGLYNAVGIGEHPLTGGIFAMDNGADDITRDGTDIHQDNPGDEMNFHGFLNGTTSISGAQEQGANYGYPECSAVWNTTIPDASIDFKVGEQFSVDNSTANDSVCQTRFVAPRLTFKPHQSPLDILFSADGTSGYISFHGSTDETNPVGYLVGRVSFDPATGQPTVNSDSVTALSEIIRNSDDADCPSSCMRPVGLATDHEGRLFFSSDATGEIYILVQSNSAEFQGGHGKTRNRTIAIAVSVTIGSILLSLCGIATWRWQRYDRVLGRAIGTGRFPDKANREQHDPIDRDLGEIQLTDPKSWGQEPQRNVFRDEVQRQEQQRAYD